MSNGCLGKLTIAFQNGCMHLEYVHVHIRANTSLEWFACQSQKLEKKKKIKLANEKLVSGAFIHQLVDQFLATESIDLGSEPQDQMGLEYIHQLTDLDANPFKWEKFQCNNQFLVGQLMSPMEVRQNDFQGLARLLVRKLVCLIVM